MQKPLIVASLLSFASIGAHLQAQTTNNPPPISCGSGGGSWPNCGGGTHTVPPGTSLVPPSSPTQTPAPAPLAPPPPAPRTTPTPSSSAPSLSPPAP